LTAREALGTLWPVKCARCNAEASLVECGLCQKSFCKKCRQSLDPTAFELLIKIPKDFSHAHYCIDCFDAKVAPFQAEYEENAAKAHEVYFLTKNYRGFVRITKRHTKRVEVRECDDRRLTILKMAYAAAELGFNAIIEAEVDDKKIRMNKYQSTAWSGSALPANIDGEQLEKSSLRGF
jgi:hypothetical protein